MKTFIFIFISAFILTFANYALAQDFSGTYTETATSKVIIKTADDGYEITFTSNGNSYGFGKGYVVGGKLYFTFYRADKSSDGGFGIYTLSGDGINGKHYNFDFSKRWSGSYKKD